jgi:hypothetical protein
MRAIPNVTARINIPHPISSAGRREETNAEKQRGGGE